MSKALRQASPVMGAWGSQVSYSGRSVSNDVTVLGVNEDYLTITNRKLLKGRWSPS